MAKNDVADALKEVEIVLAEFPTDRFDPLFLEALARSIETDDIPALTDPRLRSAMVADLRRRAEMLVN